MSDSTELPELEPLEEVATPSVAAPAVGVTPVSLPGLPAPAFGMRAQRQYYRFFFAGLLMFLGCMMPFGPEWQMAGYKTLGGSVFTIIALGIMWTSWVAIAHGKFDLSSMRWLVLSSLPLVVMIWHLIYIFDEPAVIDYGKIAEAAHRAEVAANPNLVIENIVIKDWGSFFDNLKAFRTAECSNQVDNFLRAYGTGKLILLIGSFYAMVQFVLGVGSGVKAGKAQKAGRDTDRQRKKR